MPALPRPAGAARREAVGGAPRQDIFDRVWADVVVSDGALSQAIRTLRRTLGRRRARSSDRLAHGYQFVCRSTRRRTAARTPFPWRARVLRIPPPTGAGDPLAAALARLLDPALAEDAWREAAEELHALDTAEALRRLDRAPVTRGLGPTCATAVGRGRGGKVPLLAPRPVPRPGPRSRACASGGRFASPGRGGPRPPLGERSRARSRGSSRPRDVGVRRLGGTLAPRSPSRRGLGGCRPRGRRVASGSPRPRRSSARGGPWPSPCSAPPAGPWPGPSRAAQSPCFSKRSSASTGSPPAVASRGSAWARRRPRLRLTTGRMADGLAAPRGARAAGTIAATALACALGAAGLSLAGGHLGRRASTRSSGPSRRPGCAWPRSAGSSARRAWASAPSPPSVSARAPLRRRPRRRPHPPSRRADVG